MPENQSTTSISYDPLKGHESARERLMSRGRLPPCECLWKWSDLRFSYKLRQILDKGFLSAQLVGRCTGIAEVMGSNPVQAWFFFSGLIFTTAWVLFITTRVTFVFTPLSAVQIYDLHIFTVVYIYGVVKPLHIYIYHIPLSIYLFIIYQYRGLACQVNQFFFRQIRRSVSSATQINKCLQWILDEKFLKEIHCCFGGGH